MAEAEDNLLTQSLIYNIKKSTCVNTVLLHTKDLRGTYSWWEEGLWLEAHWKRDQENVFTKRR